MTKHLMGSDSMDHNEQLHSRFKSAQDVSSHLDVEATMSGIRRKMKRKSQIRNSIAASVLVLAGVGISANFLATEDSIPLHVITMSQTKAIKALATEQHLTSSSITPQVTKTNNGAFYIFSNDDENEDLFDSMSASAGIENQLFETGYGMSLITTLPEWDCAITVGVFEDENLTRHIYSETFEKQSAGETVQVKLLEIDPPLESIQVVSFCKLSNKTTIFKVKTVTKQ